MNYRHTICAGYFGYVSQAIVNNFAPLLFLTFQSTFSIPLSKITALISINFIIQLLVDLLSSKLIGRIGFRRGAVIGCSFSAAGLLCLGNLPYILPSPYTGIIVSVVIYAIGGGLLEVLISPIVEACPTQKKASEMSLLHSFYCWGHVFVVLGSTLYFIVFGIKSWRYLAMLLALIPLADALLFSRVPVYSLKSDNNGARPGALLKQGTFWRFMLLMLCAGASEQAMSQWSSAFAESGLGVSKTMGDLLGPCLFAALMGISRVLFSRLSEKTSVEKVLTFSGILCVISYLVSSLSPWPLLALFGCAVCGLSVGALWPGCFSLGVESLPKGGTPMFALFALAGDLGCMTGPSFVGAITDAFGGEMKKGLLFALVFPVALIICVLIIKKEGVRLHHGSASANADASQG